MEADVTQPGLDTNVVAAPGGASDFHAWLPMHFSPEVSVLHGYVLLNLAILLFGRLILILDPVPRRRALRWAWAVAGLLFCVVLAWSAFLVVTQRRYFATAFVPPSPAWLSYPAAVMRQMVTWYIAPALVAGSAGLATIAWFKWRARITRDGVAGPPFRSQPAGPVKVDSEGVNRP